MNPQGAFDITTWLASLGLSQYAPGFVENHVDSEVLHSLTGDDLRELGVASVGHRRKLQDAIVKLAGASTAAVASVMQIGSPGEPVRIASAVQRRQITVVFCDLVGSTQLSATVDPEDLREYLNDYRAVLAQAIQEHKGWISQYLGDGVMAYFGYPQAHDHDTEHAVRSALTILQRCALLPLFHGKPTQVRIGIATGMTVIGKPLATGDEHEENAIGQTPNLAARAQAAAEPNTIFITPTTRQLIGNLFDCQDLGLFELKGLPEPTRLWRVVGVNANSSRFDARRVGRETVGLIGREAEMLQINALLDQTRQGQGQLLVMKAEGGMGKSRLVEHALHDQGQPAHQKLVFQCSSYNAAVPLFAVRYFVELQAGIAAADAPDIALEKLQRLMKRAGVVPAQDLAVMADFMRLKADVGVSLEGIGSHELRALLFKILLHLLQALACETGIMVVEDLHWIDPSTSELFGNLVAALPHLPVLFVATTRPDVTPGWANDENATTMVLEKLDDTQIQRLAQAIAAPQVLSASVVSAIVSRSDGVPIFAEELTRGYLESATRNIDANSQLSNIPSTLTESLLARLDSFEHGREIAPLAAVIGREFPIEFLVKLSAMDADKVQQGVAELMQAGVFIEGHSRFGKAVAFRHMLVREAAYNLLVRRERIRLHAMVANTLEKDFPAIAAASPHFVAMHLASAGESARAIAHWERAGHDADKRSAYQEAITYLQEALALNQTLAPSTARDEQEYEQRMSLISPLIAVHGHVALVVEQQVARITDLSVSLGNQTSVVAPLALKLMLLAAAGNHKATVEMAQSIQMAAIGGSEEDRLIAHRYMSTSLLFGGRFTEAVDEAENFLGLYDSQRHRQAMEKLGPSNHQVMVMVGLAQAYVIFEQPARSKIWRDRTLNDARSNNSAHTLSAVLIFAHCFLAALNDEKDELIERAQELQQTVARNDLPIWRGHADLFAGLSLIVQGQTEPGFAQARQGIGHLAATHALSNIWYILYAQACLRVSRVQEGLDSLELAVPLINSGLSWLEAEYLRLRGLLRHQRGDALEYVMYDLQAAKALAQQQGAVLFAKRAQLALKDLALS